jgi:PPOX class probable F420-dependent enzyme
MVILDEAARRILDGSNFASVATVRADGAPQVSVVWVKRDGDRVLFSTTAGRQKAKNLTAEPRVSVSIFDLANPYESVEIRGIAELTVDEDKRLPYELSHKYLGEDPPKAEPGEVRLIVRVIPEKVIRFAPDM